MKENILYKIDLQVNQETHRYGFPNLEAITKFCKLNMISKKKIQKVEFPMDSETLGIDEILLLGDPTNE